MKNKIITIGDVHGRDAWKQLIGEVKQWNKIIFIGDYVDSFNISDIEIYQNLLNIIELKKSYPEVVELLIGNHDIQYIKFNDSNFSCSGRRISMGYDLYQLFNDNLMLFKIAFEMHFNDQTWVWSHAGIHSDWLHKSVLKSQQIEVFELNFESDLINSINSLLHIGRGCLLLNQAGYSRGGFDHPGPLWADWKELKLKPIKNVNQIVGHTQIPVEKYPVDIVKIQDSDNSLYNVDNCNVAPLIFEY